MSERDANFSLRKNKFVDRRVFIDLLARLRRIRPLERYVYVGMGGRTLEDHRAIHSFLGIDMLLSFDEDATTVARQKINSPSPRARYLTMTAKEVIDSLGSVLQSAGFPADAGRIVWLDYMRPGQLGHQLQELRALLSTLDVGDVVRVTLNADVGSLGQPKGASTLEDARLQVVKSRLGEFCPSDVSVADISTERLPQVLARAVEKVANESFPATSSSVQLLPLSVIRYADGQQMLTITALVLGGDDDKNAFLEGTGLTTWPFWSKRWDEVHCVNVPFLTPRERALLEREICEGVQPAQSTLQVLFDGPVDEGIRQYALFQRYFPNFQHVWP